MFRTISLAILSGLLLWAAWPVDGFPFLLFIAFVPLLLLENDLQNVNQFLHIPFSFHVVEYINYILDSTCYLVWSDDGGTINSVDSFCIYALFMD